MNFGENVMKGLLHASRISNMPTILTNALVVCSFSLGFDAWNTWVYVICAIMGFCFYLAGMWGNDLSDFHWDSRYKPSRPLPEKLISPSFLLFLMVVVGTVGSLFYLYFSWSQVLPLLVLWASIVLYNQFHKYWSASPLLMGACRGAWVWCAATLVSMWKDVPISFDLYSYMISLGVYTALLTTIARRELHSHKAHLWVKRLLGGMCVFDAIWLIGVNWFFALIAIVCWCISFYLQKMGMRST